MTAEQRAAMWLREAGIYKGELYAEGLASAIRAAEDEALERAATSIEQRALTHGAWTSALGTAKRIRSLKSGPGVSGKDGGAK